MFLRLLIWSAFCAIKTSKFLQGNLLGICNQIKIWVCIFYSILHKLICSKCIYHQNTNAFIELKIPCVYPKFNLVIFFNFSTFSIREIQLWWASWWRMASCASAPQFACTARRWVPSYSLKFSFDQRRGPWLDSHPRVQLNFRPPSNVCRCGAKFSSSHRKDVSFDHWAAIRFGSFWSFISSDWWESPRESAY